MEREIQGGACPEKNLRGSDAPCRPLDDLCHVLTSYLKIGTPCKIEMVSNVRPAAYSARVLIYLTEKTGDCSHL